jgi:hypothetical protein
MRAQPSQHLHVNVPFDFAAGVNSLPAGEYVVGISYSPNSVWIRSADGKQGFVILTHGASSESKRNTAKLVFHVYGDRYFLARAFAGGPDGEEIAPSHDELELNASRHASKTVTVAASLR